MFWLGGLLALKVTTSTPDALCPPLEEAREVIAARVGEVHGDYRAEFALLRADDGTRALKLSVLLAEQLVLERTLPLDQAGCDDAAQTLALVLERYFDAIESPEPTPVAPPLEPVPQTGKDPKKAPKTAAPSRRVRPARTAPPQHTLHATLSLVGDRELGWAPALGLELRPAWGALGGGLRLGWGSNLAAFLASPSALVRERTIEEKTFELATWLPFEITVGSWGLAVGPWAQLRLQRAHLEWPEREASAYRGLPGLGGGAAVSFSPSGPRSRFRIRLSAAFGAQLRDASAEFALRKPDGTTEPLLAPSSTFSQLALGLAVDL